MFTHKLFDDFSDHPRMIQGSGSLKSDAAGRYQFLSTTWDECVAALGLADFSPGNQDLAAIYLMERRGALDYVRQGELRAALDLLSWEWASLPPGRYGQPIKSFKQFERYYKENLAALEAPL